MKLNCDIIILIVVLNNYVELKAITMRQFYMKNETSRESSDIFANWVKQRGQQGRISCSKIMHHIHKVYRIIIIVILPIIYDAWTSLTVTDN